MGLTSWAADGGRIPAAFGGIMDTTTGRRAYGLGSIFKSIKKQYVMSIKWQRNQMNQNFTI